MEARGRFFRRNGACTGLVPLPAELSTLCILRASKTILQKERFNSLLLDSGRKVPAVLSFCCVAYRRPRAVRPCLLDCPKKTVFLKEGLKPIYGAVYWESNCDRMSLWEAFGRFEGVLSYKSPLRAPLKTP